MELRVSFAIERPLRDLFTKLEAEKGLAPKDVLLLLMHAHDNPPATIRSERDNRQTAAGKIVAPGKEAWAFHEIPLSKPQGGQGLLQN